MLLLTVRDTTAAHVMLLLTVMDTIVAPDQYQYHHQYLHHQHQHRHQHVSIALMVPMVSIAALVILILVVPLNVMRVEIVVFHRHHHHVSIALTALVRIAALVIQILCAHLLAESTVVYHRHHHPVSFVRMVAWVSIAALVIPILVVPLNVLPVETVVFHHHQEKNAMKSVISLAVAVAVERVVKEERVEREDTMVALVDTDVTYSFMVMTMADLVDLVDLMIINSMADTMEADSEADSVLVTRNSVVVTAERVDTEEKVEKEEKEERVDTTVDTTKFVKSSVKLCTTIKLSSNEMRNVLGRSLNLPFVWNTVYNSISL